MMRWPAVVVASLLLAQDPKPVRDPWAGFPDGSWCVVESVLTSEGKSTTVKQRFTIQIEKNGSVTQLVSKEEEEPAIMFEERHHVPGQPPEGAASKPTSVELTIGGKKIACELTEYAAKDVAGKTESATRVWRTRELKVPYREIKRGGSDAALDTDVVRFEMTVKTADGSQKYEFGIVDPAAKRTVAGKELTCMLEEGTAEETSGGKTMKATIRRWLTDEIPGRATRLEVRGEFGSKKIERTETVLSWSVK